MWYRVLFAVALAAFSQSGEAQTPPFRYAFDAGLEVKLHALSVPEPGTAPHVLVSSGKEHDAGERKVQVVRAGQQDEPPQAIDLTTVPRLGSLFAFAATPVHYIVAYQTLEGMHLDLYSHSGQLATSLEAPIPEDGPVALWPTPHGVVIATNRGRYLVDPKSGGVIAREMDPDAQFTSAAALTRVGDCGLISVLVDYDAKTWNLEQRCVGKDGFRLEKTRRGPGSTERGYPFYVGADPDDRSRALVATPRDASSWLVHDCPLGRDTSCDTSTFNGAPIHPGLLVRAGGLQLYPLKSAIGVISGTDDLRQLWTGRYAREGGAPSWSTRWPAPVFNSKGYSLLVAALASPDDEGAWLASMHWAFNGDWQPGNAPTEHRRVLEVARSSYRELFNAR